MIKESEMKVFIIVAAWTFILSAVSPERVEASEFPEGEWFTEVIPLAFHGMIRSPESMEFNSSHNAIPIHGDTVLIDIIDRAGYGSTFCSAIDENRLYVGACASLLIYELEDTGLPSFLDHWYTPDVIWNLCVRGDTAFVANGADGFRIVDCSVPGDLNEVGFLENDSTGYAYGVDVQGEYAYLADGIGGLLVIDISDPTEPSKKGSYILGNESQYLCKDVRVSGNTAYAVFIGVNGNDPGPSTLGLIDVSNPQAPDTISTYQTGYFLVTSPYALELDPDSTVYIANGLSKDLYVVDCSDPYNIEERGYFHNYGCFGFDVAVTDDKIYLADGYRGEGVNNFFVFEKDDIVPDMEPVAEYMTLDIAWGVSARDGIAYVSDEWGGLAVLDCSEPPAINPLTTFDTGGYYQDLGITGDRIYVAARGGKVRVVFQDDSGGLCEVAKIDTRGLASGIAVDSDTLFIAEGYDPAQGPSGLEILYAEDLEDPELIGELDLGWDDTCFDLTVRDSLIFIANGATGLTIVNASDRHFPRTLTSVDTPGIALDVFVEGNFAYVADCGDGLQLIEISDPENAFVFNFFDTPDTAFGVWVENGIAYLANGTEGLLIIDCTNPATLEELSSVQTPGMALRVQVSGSLAFVTSMGGGVSVFNVEDARNPRGVGWFETTFKPYGISVVDNLIYVTDSFGGLFLLKYRMPFLPQRM